MTVRELQALVNEGAAHVAGFTIIGRGESHQEDGMTVVDSIESERIELWPAGADRPSS